MKEIEVKYQACNLCDALHRNINSNFESVSFDILDNGDIKIKIVLNKKTEIEEEHIDDLVTEFEALQQTNCVKEVTTNVGKHYLPLKYLVYQKE